jgi:hypothetical protein
LDDEELTALDLETYNFKVGEKRNTPPKSDSQANFSDYKKSEQQMLNQVSPPFVRYKDKSIDRINEEITQHSNKT